MNQTADLVIHLVSLASDEVQTQKWAPASRTPGEAKPAGQPLQKKPPGHPGAAATKLGCTLIELFQIPVPGWIPDQVNEFLRVDPGIAVL